MAHIDLERQTVGWTMLGAALLVKTAKETRMHETEGNEANKEDNPCILILVIVVTMTEQVSPCVSGLLRSLR
jgi:hypothetical protein